MNEKQDLVKITVWREYDIGGVLFYVVKLTDGYLVRDEDATVFYFVKAGSHREAVAKILTLEGVQGEPKYTGAWDVENMKFVNLPEEEVVE
ncbi:MAG: hypothetical protein ACPLRJ_07885 [Infirmifilum uzonense]|uniref:hypothetical protein n=1 Tax=Infirmifilum uzonense TaxID=1550241 RepID=UPI003C74F380